MAARPQHMRPVGRQGSTSVSKAQSFGGADFLGSLVPSSTGNTDWGIIEGYPEQCQETDESSVLAIAPGEDARGAPDPGLRNLRELRDASGGKDARAVAEQGCAADHRVPDQCPDAIGLAGNFEARHDFVAHGSGDH